jgi:RNA polymerase sigma-70 factor (ECF subfamily)
MGVGKGSRKRRKFRDSTLIRRCDVRPTPVVALSRAIARSRVLGAQTGLEEILRLDGRERLDAYPFYWAALGDLALRQGERTRASQWLTRGLACARTETERELFLRRIDECRGVRS